MNTYQIKTHSMEETMTLGSELAALLEPNDVITLEGDLGVGKTAFTKGIAKGLQISRMVTSPTFTIVKQYQGTLALNHMDAYRLEHSEEDIGFDEYFNSGGVSVVEWAQFIEDYLPPDRLAVEISYVDEYTRNLVFKPIGSHFTNIITELKNKSCMIKIKN